VRDRHEIQQRFALGSLAPALEGRTGLAALLTAIDTYVEVIARGGDTARAFYVLMSESLGPMPEIRPTFASANAGFRSLLEGWIRDGIEAGEIRTDVDARARAAWVVGTLRGIALQCLVDPSGLDVAPLRRDLRCGLEASLRAPSR